MREIKNKEVIIGLVVIIVLSIIAIFLIVQREISQAQKYEQVQNEVLQYSNNAVKSDVEQNDTMTKENMDSTGENTNYNDASDNVVVEEKNTIRKVVETKEPQINVVVDMEKQIDIQDKYSKHTLIERKTRDHQLEELFEYWDEYKLEAVDDLIHLERIIEISDELKGTDNYYYYGTVNGSGQPNGRGLAVYADNAYYCGDFIDGDRSGNGMWLQTYVYDEDIAPENRIIVEHSYNGEWKNDKPNGEGQEHYEYNYEMIPDGARYLNNVIGGFADGYYNGDMYLMIITNSGDTSDWNGTAQKGAWLPQEKANKSGEIPIWVAAEVEQSYFWIYPEDNKGYGIVGFK